jgi:phenylacetate-CoA ligase
MTPPLLKKEIETLLRDRLAFTSEIELVPAGTLPKYEFKAQIFEKTYERRSAH